MKYAEDIKYEYDAVDLFLYTQIYRLLGKMDADQSWREYEATSEGTGTAKVKMQVYHQYTVDILQLFKYPPELLP